MSEKFMVGQWVTVGGEVRSVVEIDESDGTVRTESRKGVYLGWRGTGDCQPFVWQVGKTYRTTLDGVTATVDGMMGSDRITVDCDWEHDTEGIHAATFSVGTGKLFGFENRTDVPHLLPYLADEPAPVAEAATYSEFTEAGGFDVVNHPPHYTQHPSGVECCDIAEHFNFCVGNAIKYLWRAGLKGSAVEDLKKAAWYVQREIERMAKR